LISQPISQPNWKFSRRSSIDHERFVSMRIPSSVAATMPSSGSVPGTSPTFVIRTIGIRSKPSPRTAPPDGMPARAAESRPDRTPTQTPSRTMSTG
jgi:hypothetical protein